MKRTGLILVAIGALLATCLTVWCVVAPPVLVFSPNGTFVPKASLASAFSSSDAAGKEICVVFPATPVTTALALPTDRTLTFRGMGYVSLSGDGALTGLKEARPENFGAIANDGVDDTAAVQNAIKAVGGTHHTGHYGTVELDGRYIVTQVRSYAHVRIVGKGNGTNHSSAFDAWQTELKQPAGTNLHVVLFDESSTDDSFVNDIGIENISIRSGWTGIGDTTTTTGSAIAFVGVTPGQNVHLRDIQGKDLAGDVITLTRHALPGQFENIWGRKVGGSVISVATVSGRGSHMFYANNIQGDYVVGPMIKIDESALADSDNTGHSYLFTNLKHEIDPDGANVNAYSGTTVELKSVAGNVTVINANPQTSVGSPAQAAPGEPVAVVQITGTRVPHLTVIGSRMGSYSANSSPGYLIKDDVLGLTVGKEFNSATWNQSTYRYDTTQNETTVIEESRKRSTGGVSDAYARFKRQTDGKMHWGPGDAQTDTTMYRAAYNRITTDGGFQAKRIMARGGTVLVADDFGLTGWGTGATLTVDSGATDQRWRVTITCGATPSANPKLRLTFHDVLFTGSLKWAVAPQTTASFGHDSTGTPALLTVGAPDINSVDVYYIGTPVEGMTYIITGVSMG